MSEVKDKGIISRKGLVAIVPDLEESQLEQLFKSKGTNRGIVGKKTVIDTLTTLTEEQKSSIVSFRFPPKTNETPASSTSATVSNNNLSTYTDNQLLAGRRKIRARIRKLEEELTTLKSQHEAHNAEIDKR